MRREGGGKAEKSVGGSVGLILIFGPNMNTNIFGFKNFTEYKYEYIRVSNFSNQSQISMFLTLYSFPLLPATVLVHCLLVAMTSLKLS